MDNILQDILLDKFGLVQFRPRQLNIIKNSIEKQDIYVCMPTGSGKSLCFLFENFVNNKILIIIQPLLALLLDFSRQLTNLKVK